jgi:large subunit ribosomal protein L9
MYAPSTSADRRDQEGAEHRSAAVRNRVEEPIMEVILRETIDTLGRAGQVVKVADGYARNYLLPRKLAYLATPGNLKVIEFERQSLVRKDAKQQDEATKLKEMLDKVEVVIRRKVGEADVLYGSVTNSDVADELEKKGFNIEKRKIHMDDHIKKLGEYELPVRLFKDVVSTIKVKVEAEPQ